MITILMWRHQLMKAGIISLARRLIMSWHRSIIPMILLLSHFVYNRSQLIYAEKYLILLIQSGNQVALLKFSFWCLGSFFILSHNIVSFYKLPKCSFWPELRTLIYLRPINIKCIRYQTENLKKAKVQKNKKNLNCIDKSNLTLKIN